MGKWGRVLVSALLWFFSVGASAEGAAAATTGSQPWQQCFSNVAPEHEFLRAIAETSQNQEEAANTLNESCADDEMIRKGIFSNQSKILQSLGNGFVHALYGFIGMSLGDVTGLRSDEQYVRDYETALSQIKTDKNRYHRIRAAYELSITHQGKYSDTVADALEAAAAENEKTENPSQKRENTVSAIREAIVDEILKSPTPFRTILDIWDVRPSRVIEKAHDTGFGGVCKHFVTLLYYNFVQVARPYGDKDAHVGDNAFSANIVGNRIHVWSRVNVSRRDQNGILKFNSFDLDSTLYPDHFVPLYPRNSWDAKGAERATNACRKVYDCVKSN